MHHRQDWLFLKIKTAATKWNKTPLRLLPWRSQNRRQRWFLPRHQFLRCFSPLSGGGCSSLLWNARELNVPHPPIHKKPGGEPPALTVLLGPHLLSRLAPPPAASLPHPVLVLWLQQVRRLGFAWPAAGLWPLHWGIFLFYWGKTGLEPSIRFRWCLSKPGDRHD